MVTLTFEQLEERLAALHRASLELVRDISLESLLHRIATMACEQVNARYAAVGVWGKTASWNNLFQLACRKKKFT
jgi:two-component system, NarL family, sensor histidine kinase DevS